MSKLNALKKKIAALKAKTSANGCTEAEAMAAAELAAKLMAEHGLSEEDIAYTTASMRSARDYPLWQSGLASMICKHTNTYALFRHEPGVTLIEFTGREHEVEIALYLRDVLVRAINTALRNLRGTLPYRRLRKQTSKSNMTYAFTCGMISRIDRKLTELFGGQRNDQVRAIAKRMVHLRFPDAEDVKMRHRNIENSNAYWAGMAAGDKVNLGHGVTGAAGGPKLIGGAS